MPDGRRVQFPTPDSRTRNPDHANPQPAPNAAPPNAGGKTPDLAAPAEVPGLPPSLLDQPAQPAKVVLANGRLSVQAENSSLRAILDSIETTSGMTIDGFGKDQRIFGHYGPGNPSSILSQLLDDAGYNVLMVGDTNAGTPHHVILTGRSNAPVTPSASPGDGQDEDQPAFENNNPPPGPVERPANNVASPDAGGHVKTPAEILQELQRMRAQEPQQPQ